VSDAAAAKKAKKKRRPKGTGAGEKKKRKEQTPYPLEDDDERMSSFCALEVYKRTKVTRDQRQELRKWLVVLAVSTVVQFAVGGYLYSLTTGKYQPKRGSWYVGVLPVAIIIWGWRVQTHTGLCINLALGALSSLIALAGGLLDLAASGHMLELNACAGFGSVEWFGAAPGGASQLAALSACIAREASFSDGILPPSVCVCSAGKKSACVSPYEMAAADSCKVMGPYGGLLLFAFILCVLCVVVNVILVLKEVHIIKTRAREIHAKYGDLYGV